MGGVYGEDLVGVGGQGGEDQAVEGDVSVRSIGRREEEAESVQEGREQGYRGT